jgi:exodeoxyribonuclease V alpha subunit
LYEYIFGKVVYLPRKFYDPQGKKRLGELLILEGNEAGNKLKFDLLDPPPSVAVLRNSLVRLYGYRENGVLIVPDKKGIMPQITYEGLQTLMKHNMPNVDVNVLLRAAGVNKFDDICRLYESDYGEFAAKMSAVLDADTLKELEKFFRDNLLEQDFNRLRYLLTEAEVGIDFHVALKIYDTLKHRANRRGTTVSALVEKDPWIIAQVEDVTFKQADEVARYLGIEPGIQPSRVMGAVFHVLWDFARNGDSYCPKFTLIDAAVKKLKKSGDDKNGLYEEVKSYFNHEEGNEEAERPARGKWVTDTNFAYKEIAADYDEYYRKTGVENPKGKAANRGAAVYLCGVFFPEREAARNLVLLAAGPRRMPVVAPARFVEAAVEECPHLVDDEEQKEFLRAVVNYPVVLLTGAAGTGKTEVLAAAIRAYKKIRPEAEIKLMAPTGVAAQRVGKRAGVPGRTAHLGLRIFREMEDYADPENSSLEAGKEELVVVDEMSMCNIVVFNRILEYAALSNARLILAGDPGQLGSPGPGNVLGDLVRLAGYNKKSHRGILQGMKHVELKTVHRASAVVENANKIRKGKNPSKYKEKKFEFLTVGDNNHLEVLDGLLDTLGAEGVPVEDMLILSSVKGESKGRKGVETLNAYLQQRYNAAGKEIPGTRFRVGDKVICTENDYLTENEPGRKRRTVLNGEIGVISRYEDDTLTVRYGEGDEQPYTPAEAVRWLQLAYALTVHKAQGGEAPVVILVDFGSGKLDRFMLYTAVTRARYDKDKPYSERIYFVGRPGFVEEAIKREGRPRYSKLYYRVLDNVGVAVSKKKKDKGDDSASGAPKLPPWLQVPPVAAKPVQSL